MTLGVVRGACLGQWQLLTADVWISTAVNQNPYEPSLAASSPPVDLSRAGGRGVRLSVFFANCLLLLLFPPICCPCGLGPFGFVVLPYMMLLGFPTVLSGYAVAGDDASRGVFLCAYVVKYVVVSYLTGVLAGRAFVKRSTTATG